ncbi:hypothetical protein BGZ73_008224 [Actinomortierella ambigua]|nr:hypothetical protein BGZ73_008224 [Actinomortierella ambigua]
MSIEYHQARYMSALKERACLYRCEEFPVAVKIIDCVVDVIEAPHIEVIPTRRLSHDIHCTTPTCTIGYEDRTTVSTTHSVNAGFGAAMSSAPFGMGVEFTKSVGYGFSKTNEESTAFSYEFNIEHGDSGYIGVASAQISAKIRRQGRVAPAQLGAPTGNFKFSGYSNPVDRPASMAHTTNTQKYSNPKLK